MIVFYVEGVDTGLGVLTVIVLAINKEDAAQKINEKLKIHGQKLPDNAISKIKEMTDDVVFVG